MPKCILPIAMILLTAATAAAESDPQVVLADMLAGGDAEAAWVALRATEDANLQPMLEALSRSPSPARRRFALAALAELLEDRAADLLAEHAFGEEDRGVRLEAAARLLWLDGVSDEIIERALASEDREVRSMAVDTMVRHGRGFAVADQLRTLAACDHAPTACSARLNLLSLGHRDQLVALEQTIADAASPQPLLMRICAQVGEDELTTAGEMVLRLAESDRPVELRLQAWRAVSKVVPGAASLLGEAIASADSTVLRVNLLAILGDTDQPRSALETLARNEDSVTATLAAFDLARLAGGPQAATAAAAAVALEHPVVVEYVLDRAETDVQDRGRAAEFYIPAMRKVIAQADTRASRMAAEHVRAARAATILADIGSGEAADTLRELLAQRYSPVVRAVGAGLVRSNTPLARELARPLLNSPYEELATDAALVLGRAGDSAARDKLYQFIAPGGRYPAPLRAMSAWYLLKIAGRTDPAARQLAEQVN